MYNYQGRKRRSNVFKENQQDHNIGSKLILNGLLKISRQDILRSTRVFFKNMFLVKLINNTQYFMFRLIIQKIQANWIFFMLLALCFEKMKQIFVVLAAWILHLSTLGGIFLQEILQGKLNRLYPLNNMATQAGLYLKLHLCLKNKVIKVSSVLGTKSYNGLKRHF